MPRYSKEQQRKGGLARWKQLREDPDKYFGWLESHITPEARKLRSDNLKKQREDPAFVQKIREGTLRHNHSRRGEKRGSQFDTMTPEQIVEFKRLRRKYGAERAHRWLILERLVQKPDTTVE